MASPWRSYAQLADISAPCVLIYAQTEASRVGLPRLIFTSRKHVCKLMGEWHWCQDVLSTLIVCHLGCRAWTGNDHIMLNDQLC